MQLHIIVRNGMYLRYYFELIWHIPNMIRRKKGTYMSTQVGKLSR